MNWTDVGKKIAGLGLPLLANALLPGSGAVVATVAEALGVTDPTPDNIAKAIDADPDAAVKLAEIQSNQRIELARIAMQGQVAERQADSDDVAQVNKTMRAEAASSGWYKGGWRPYFGYIVSTCIGATFIALVHAMWVKPEDIVNILNSAADLIVVSVAVLGVNIHKRSQDRQTAFGDRPLGIMEAVAQRIGRP